MRGLRGRLALAAATSALLTAGAALAAQPHSYAIPPGTTAEALNAYARQSGRQLVFPYDAAAATRSAGVQGALADDAALGQVLKGSKLTLASLDGKVVTLRAAAFPVGSIQAAAAPGPAASADAGAEVSEVVVTANKKTERLIDVASAVTALSGDTLQQRRLTRIEDFASQVPGFSLQSGGGAAGGVRLILRGLNSGGSGATVSTLIDEASLTYTSANGLGSLDTANIDTYDLERIEVLRGPQGTLYGSAAEGGLLKYVFNQPKLGKTQASFESEVNGVDGGGVGYSFHGMINEPIGDTLAFRASGFYYKDAGYIDNPLAGRKDVNDGERYGGRVSLYWKPNETFNIRASALQQKTSYNSTSQVEVNGVPANNIASATSAQFNIADGGALQRNSYTPEPYTRKFGLYDVTANLILPWVNVTSITAYGRNDAFFRTDYRDLPIAPTLTYGGFLAGAYRQPVVPYGLQLDRLEKFTQELRGSSRGLKLGEMPLDAQAGFYWTRERSNYDQNFNTAPLSNLNTILTSPTVLGGVSLPGLYEEYSGFVDLTLHLTDKWQLSSGARFTHDDLTTQSVERAGILHPVTPAVLYHPAVTVSEDPITWSFATRYSLNSRVNAYARVASGFRPGGPNLPLPGVPTPPNYKSDSTVNYEIGAKGDVLDRKVSFDVALFYIDWTDIQILSSVLTSGGTKNITGNAGTATSKGVEWNLAWTPVPRLTLAWSGAYTDAYLTVAAPPLGAAKGDQLPYVPKFTSNLNVDYSWPLTSAVRASVGGTWSYIDDRSGAFTASPVQINKPRIPSYDTVQLFGSVDWDRYSVQAYVQNLTDDRGITNYTSTSGYLGTGLADIIRPRTFGLRASVRY